MNENDKKTVLVGVARLASVFLRSRIDDLGLLSYWDGVKNKIGDVAHFNMAVQLALEEFEHMPAPIDLTRLARRAMREARPMLPPMAEEEKRRILESWKKREE